MSCPSTGNNTVNAADKSGQSAGQFAASLVTGLVVFAVQVLAFLIIKDRLARIYQPRTYLVPDRERTRPVAPGWWAWIKPVVSTSNSEFVQKCGLDAYFFLRYLRFLLKIFVPATITILPVLLPVNAVGGRGADWALSHPNSSNITGLDQLSWSNVKPGDSNRYWAHWILALLLIVWVCYTSFDELKNYIRMRQAYITSPQHRLRASATTVLVSSIPAKWLSVEALEGLYDVFPGGLRNIWLNRNFDKLNDKIKKRNKLAQKLESTETDLIRNCYKKHEEAVQKAAKAAGKKTSKGGKEPSDAQRNAQGQQHAAQSTGLDSGDPHQVRHTVREALTDQDNGESPESAQHVPEKHRVNLPVIGDGLDRFGKGLIGGIRGVNRGVIDQIDTTNGFAVEAENTLGSTVNDTEQVTQTLGRSSMASPSSSGVDGTSEQPRIPEVTENDQIPLTLPDRSPTEKVAEISSTVEQPQDTIKQPSLWQKVAKLFGAGGDDEDEPIEYPSALEEELRSDHADALWRKYFKEKDRDTYRVPIFDWMPSLWLIGKKVDTIYYCRAEVAQLNLEIEDDQAHPERFPLMNSAFIQFNHQVAAHMACQSISHHLPKQMNPRIVEIDPNDVIWDNMSIPWWSRYVRTAGVILTVAGLVIIWAVPVAFTSALSQLSQAACTYHWLAWILRAPGVIFSILQGVLSPALLGLLLFLLPLILRYLSKLQGTQSGVLVELAVQKYYFGFLFVQVFLVVTVVSSAVTFFSDFQSVSRLASIPNTLAINIPKTSNYFFSYMLLQALSTSAGALLQVGSLVSWFIFAKLFDSTARAKFQRQTNLSDVQWGTFFPVYTNLACIGLIYSVISPLILVFNVITFSLFWFVYRYQTLYVTRFTMDTGGLLFPNAVNTTFVGVYVMEVALIFMFFLIEDTDGNLACKGQAIGMIVILILTAGYQTLLNNAFSPLYRYLPITLEDDAVRRDEEFARAMRSKQGYVEDSASGDEIEDRLSANERASLDADRQTQAYELQKMEKDKIHRSGSQRHAWRDIDGVGKVELQNPDVHQDIDRENRVLALTKRAAHRTADTTLHKLPDAFNLPRRDQGGDRLRKGSWAQSGRSRRSAHFGGTDPSQSPDSQRARSGSDANPNLDGRPRRKASPPRKVLDTINNFNPISGNAEDVEAQRKARHQLADALFSGVIDELEELSPEQRDVLVQRAFQHAALRARRPVIWLPRDELGVSDDEVTRMGRFSKHLWVSNVRQGLDTKGRCIYSGAPPDFSELDVMRL